MVELTAPIANVLSTNLLLVEQLTLVTEDVGTDVLRTYKKIMIDSLKERPGLECIAYTAIHDEVNFSKSLQKICERALELKDANVNFTIEFILDKTVLTPLYYGHKPKSLMIDNRSPI